MEIPGLLRADAAIVGSSLTGLLLAAALSHEGVKVVVLEYHPQPCAVDAALLSPPQFGQIEAIHGLEAARCYATALQTQLQALTDAPLSYVQALPAYVYARQEEALPALAKQHELLSGLNIPVRLAPDAGGCPFPVERSLLLQGQAMVNLPRWQAALRRDIRLRGGKFVSAPRIMGLDGHRVCTPHTCVEAPHIVLTADVPPGLRDKQLIALLETRRVVHCALTGPFLLHSCQLPVSEGGLSLLPTATGALAFWDAGRLGMPRQQHVLARFSRTLDALLPDWQRGEYHYSQAICTLDGLPIIGALPHSGLICAAGLGRCGILGAMHAADVLFRRVLGRASPADSLYAPDRKLPSPFRRQCRTRLTRLYALNMFRRSAPACAHCHCRMRYSVAVQRWECPCCATCYTMLGQPVSGPGIREVRVSVRQRPDI